MSFAKPWGNYLLEKIVETPAPKAISLWPETIAWQIIFIGLIVFAFYKGYQAWKTYQANRYRREALVWLKACSLTDESELRQLPTLLRKTALLANEASKAHPNKVISAGALQRQEEINQLSSKEWAKWLDSHCSKTHFTEQNEKYSPAKLLAEIAYKPQLNLQDEEFTQALNKLYLQISLWLQHHQFTAENFTETLGEQHD